jgi:GNAT superfamily N-acetyltransferase
MSIELLQNGELPLLIDLIPPGWDTAIPAIEYYTKSNFCFPFKIIVDTKIAGTGTAIIHNKTAWLAHIIVHPEYRNQGLGKIITQYLVETSYSKGCETIYLLATELGEPVYEKVGFETETEYVLYKGIKMINPLKYSENIQPFNSEFQDEISNLDRQVSGEDRMFHLEQFLSSGYVYLHENEVKGFFLPDFGEGLILAVTDSAGLELMKFRLRTKDNAAFPMDNFIASEFMTQNNFHPERKLKRMRLGKKNNWQAANIYNRIGGNLG